MPAELLRRDPNIGALPKKARSAVSGRLRAGGSVLLLMGLAGCGGDNAAQTAALKCPHIEIPKELSIYDLTRNGSTNPRDLIVESKISNYYGGCNYGDKDVTVGVDIEFTSVRGPAAGLQTSVPANYFVAVTDAQGKVLDKAVFTVNLPVPKEGITPRETTREPLEQVIPLSNLASGSSYKIVVGFQLSPQQLEFNRHRGVLPEVPGAAAAAAGRKTIAPVIPDPRTTPPAE
jgi:hypothetical protein